jgi:hypothetical protein
MKDILVIEQRVGKYKRKKKKKKEDLYLKRGNCKNKRKKKR